MQIPEIPAHGIAVSDNRIKATRLIKRAEQAHWKRQDKLSSPYLNLGIQLSKQIYRERLTVPFQAYLALKYENRSGRVQVADAHDQVRRIMGHQDTRQATKAIQRAIELGWIGTDGQRLYIRSFKYLEKNFKIKSRTAAVLRLDDICNIREWIAGHFMANRYRYFDQVRKKGRAYNGRKASGRECALSILADELNISRATAHYLKHRAIKQGYLRAKNRIECLEIAPGYKDIASKYLDDPALFIEAGQVFRRLPDLLTFNLDAPGTLRLIHFTKRRRSCN